jgi:quercetin dioxygenase-like cupin family protein
MITPVQALLLGERPMNADRSTTDLLNRRTALAAGAALVCGAGSASAAVEKFDLASYEKIPAQKFPWGWIRWLMSAQIDPQAEMTLGIVHVDAHQSNPLHVHPNSAEFLHVLSGSCRHQTGERWDALGPGSTIRIPQGVPHRATTQDEPCLVMVVYNTGKRQMVPASPQK